MYRMIQKYPWWIRFYDFEAKKTYQILIPNLDSKFKLGYCFLSLLSVLLPASTLAPLQIVLDAAVRLVVDMTRSRDTGDVWTSLVINNRENQVKLCLSVYRAVNSRLVVHERIWPIFFTPVVNIPGRAFLRSAGSTICCFAFETGLIKAGVLRRCTKSVEQPAHCY